MTQTQTSEAADTFTHTCGCTSVRVDGFWRLRERCFRHLCEAYDAGLISELRAYVR